MVVLYGLTFPCESTAGHSPHHGCPFPCFTLLGRLARRACEDRGAKHRTNTWRSAQLEAFRPRLMPLLCGEGMERFDLKLAAVTIGWGKDAVMSSAHECVICRLPMQYSANCLCSCCGKFSEHLKSFPLIQSVF